MDLLLIQKILSLVQVCFEHGKYIAIIIGKNLTIAVKGVSLPSRKGQNVPNPPPARKNDCEHWRNSDVILVMG
jgi:hypothetical protein